MDALRLVQNYEALGEKLEKACLKYGRNPSGARLVAVSKFHPAGAVAAIARVGQVDFGENYVQEALEKIDSLSGNFPDLRWHMIGHVQSRKASLVAGAFALIHTLDSVKLADGLERRLNALGKKQPVLMEVNIANEPQKSGIPPDGLEALGVHALENCPHLELRGLMCLPPVFDSGDAARPFFEHLRELRDRLAPALGIQLPELSMGMSGDFAAAIAEGATIVRIGTDIFGPRPQKKKAISTPPDDRDSDQ